jgi:signal transduction histidine kinase
MASAKYAAAQISPQVSPLLLNEEVDINVNFFPKNKFILAFKNNLLQYQFVSFERRIFDQKGVTYSIAFVSIVMFINAIKWFLYNSAVMYIMANSVYAFMVAFFMSVGSLICILGYYIFHYLGPESIFLQKFLGKKFVDTKICLLFAAMLLFLVSQGFHLVGVVKVGGCEDDIPFLLCNPSQATPPLIMTLNLLIGTIFVLSISKGVMPFIYHMLCMIMAFALVFASFLMMQPNPTAVYLVPFCAVMVTITLIEYEIYYQEMTTFEYHMAVERAHEIRLQETKDKAETEKAQLKMILANVAHDLKTPLQAFSAGMHSLAAISAIASAAAPILEDMRASYAFMMMQINRALDVSKSDNNCELIPKPESFFLGSVVSWAVNIMSSIQSQIRVKVDDATSMQVLNKFILTDKVWLQENLLCLLSNSCKYSPEDSTVSVSVRHIEASETGSGLAAAEAGLPTSASTRGPCLLDMLLIEVRDEGVGVSDAMREKLFKPFAQAQRRAGGTGLGLYSLALRVQALGGDFGVRNVVGGDGSIFYFSIPFTVDTNCSADGTAAGAAIARSQLSSRESFLQEPVMDSPFVSEKIVSEKLTSSVKLEITNFDAMNVLTPSVKRRENVDGEAFIVLIVDDSPTVLKVLARAIKQAGAVVEQATNGFSALKLMRTKKYTAVIMDIQMPIMV